MSDTKQETSRDALEMISESTVMPLVISELDRTKIQLLKSTNERLEAQFALLNEQNQRFLRERSDLIAESKEHDRAMRSTYKLEADDRIDLATGRITRIPKTKRVES
jgi:hypothetical protein